MNEYKREEEARCRTREEREGWGEEERRNIYMYMARQLCRRVKIIRALEKDNLASGDHHRPGGVWRTLRDSLEMYAA